jgi:hypothetical protein
VQKTERGLLFRADLFQIVILYHQNKGEVILKDAGTKIFEEIVQNRPNSFNCRAAGVEEEELASNRGPFGKLQLINFPETYDVLILRQKY